MVQLPPRHQVSTLLVLWYPQASDRSNIHVKCFGCLREVLQPQASDLPTLTLKAFSNTIFTAWLLGAEAAPWEKGLLFTHRLMISLCQTLQIRVCTRAHVLGPLHLTWDREKAPALPRGWMQYSAVAEWTESILLLTPNTLLREIQM